MTEQQVTELTQRISQEMPEVEVKTSKRKKECEMHLTHKQLNLKIRIYNMEDWESIRDLWLML